MTETAVRSAAEPQIDRDLLREAQRHLGVAAPNEAINSALNVLVQHKRFERREALKELRKMSADGAFDYAAYDEGDE
ncbi:type II toxin-antitoxin system VapB family antitoxin [Dactylosporangium sp. NPDC000555]|uniref:type II toxin-antitoxin system VapB family antitoxin n=1 Tax=Dactylosporangium sp. NPDC000555 TaxID=3154260 RepID=UPI00331667E7